MSTGKIDLAQKATYGAAKMQSDRRSKVSAAPVGRLKETNWQRNNAVFTGISVRSGTAKVLAVATGANTEFALIASALQRRIPETGFAHGIRQFGYLMTQIMLAIVIVVFFANLMLARPLIESLLFSGSCSWLDARSRILTDAKSAT